MSICTSNYETICNNLFCKSQLLMAVLYTLCYVVLEVIDYSFYRLVQSIADEYAGYLYLQDYFFYGQLSLNLTDKINEISHWIIKF